MIKKIHPLWWVIGAGLCWFLALSSFILGLGSSFESKNSTDIEAGWGITQFFLLVGVVLFGFALWSFSAGGNSSTKGDIRTQTYGGQLPKQNVGNRWELPVAFISFLVIVNVYFSPSPWDSEFFLGGRGLYWFLGGMIFFVYAISHYIYKKKKKSEANSI